MKVIAFDAEEGVLTAAEQQPAVTQVVAWLVAVRSQGKRREAVLVSRC